MLPARPGAFACPGLAPASKADAQGMGLEQAPEVLPALLPDSHSSQGAQEAPSAPGAQNQPRREKAYANEKIRFNDPK